MNRLASQDYRDVVSLIYIAESDLEPTHLRTNVLPAMERIFRAHSGTFFLAAQGLNGLDLTSIVVHNIDESASSQYAQYYWQLDPMYPKGTFPTKSVLKNSDVIPPSRWSKLEYYNDFHRPLDEHWELDIYLRSGASIFGWICLFRSRQQPDFDERDISKANVIASCLSGALRNAILFSKTEDERNMFRDIIEFCSEGIIVLNSELQPVYCNSKAKELCRFLAKKRWKQQKGAQDNAFQVPLEIIENCLVPKRLFQSEGQVYGADNRVAVFSKYGKRIRIESSPVQRFLSTSGAPQFLLSLRDLSETRRDGGEVAEKALCLTQREMDILRYIADGLTNKEIADRLLISRFTVQTHLKNIFKKTGFRNRTQLAGYAESSQVFPGGKACVVTRS